MPGNRPTISQGRGGQSDNEAMQNNAEERKSYLATEVDQGI